MTGGDDWRGDLPSTDTANSPGVSLSTVRDTGNITIIIVGTTAEEISSYEGVSKQH